MVLEVNLGNKGNFTASKYEIIGEKSVSWTGKLTKDETIKEASMTIHYKEPVTDQNLDSAEVEDWEMMVTVV